MYAHGSSASKHTIYCGVLFIAFLPLISPSGVSINFTFILLLFISPFVRFNYLPVYVPLIIAASLISYALGFFSLIEKTDGVLRQFLSFGAYMSFLLVLLIRIPVSTDKIYKILLVVCAGYAVLVLYHVILDPQFSLMDYRSIKRELREYVNHWPQRFPVIMMAGFFYALIKSRDNVRYMLPALLILSCLFITFTRAIYVSLAVGFLYLGWFLFLKFRFLDRRLVSRYIKVVMLLVIIVSVLIYSDALFISVFFEVFLEATNTIVSFLSGDIVGARMAGSDSIRVFFWEKSLSIWSEHPLFGTGFAGIYQFSDIGSTHNQYLDVLLRSGIIGLLLYLTLWLNLLRFYFYRPEIAAGMFAIFTYGFLHETTKLSYTGLLFVLLLSKMFQEKRRLQLPTPLKRA